MADEHDSKTGISEKKPFKDRVKQSWDWILPITAIIGMKIWFEIIDIPNIIYPPNTSWIPLLITLFLVCITIGTLVFSIIRHKEGIKGFYNKPKHTIEYAVDPDKPKSDWLFFHLVSF